MKPLLVIRTGLTASAIAHLSALMLLLFFTEVHPFGSVTAEPIAVDIVTPAEAPPPPKKEEPPTLPELKAKPSDTFDLSTTSAKPSLPPAAQPPPQQQQQPKQRPKQQQQQAATSSPPPAPQPANAQPPPTTPVPAYAPPQPDLSVKYHVMLGLPPDLPVGRPQEKSADAGDADTSAKADIASSFVTEFRRHLKTCSKLPASVSPSDRVTVRMRVFLTPEGKLAADPAAMEGSPSEKGIDLKQSAADALQACQPYEMLPADRYGEWKIMDLTFTPQDFVGG